MTAEQTYCATCGELIIRISDRWMHIEMPERIHPATPRVTAGETFQALRAELARVNAENAAMRMALGMYNQEAPEPDPLLGAHAALITGLYELLNPLGLCPDDDKAAEAILLDGVRKLAAAYRAYFTEVGRLRLRDLEMRATLRRVKAYLGDAADHPDDDSGMRALVRAVDAVLPEQAPGPLETAVEQLRRAWDRLSACVDEFEPGDMQACGEYRDALDTAILAVLNAAKGGEAPADEWSYSPGSPKRRLMLAASGQSAEPAGPAVEPSESFSVLPDMKYAAIWWGPTLICTVWSPREGAEHLCAILEALRQHDAAALADAWARFRDYRQAGRH